MRTMTKEHREYVKERLVQVVTGVTESMRGKCEIKIDESYPCLYNDDTVVDILENSAKTIIGEENIISLKKPTMRVESFAYFSMERPSAFYYLGTGNAEKDTNYPLHSNYFNVDEDAITIGVEIHCKTVIDFLNNL